MNAPSVILKDEPTRKPTSDKPIVAPKLRIPAWARNGGIAYCRWDGGPAEVAKAHLSGWEYVTSPAAARAMDDWFDERGFELVREGGFNWIWVTWSPGFSYKSEAFQHDIVRPFIARCRAEGIHVTAYLSLCNLFHWDVEQNQPGLLKGIQRDSEGKPVPYPAHRFFGAPTRILGCLNHPKWRSHLKNRLRSAVEAGAEAAFYDNMAPWCQCEICQKRFRDYTKAKLGHAIKMPKQQHLSSPFFQEVSAKLGAKDDARLWELVQVYFADVIQEVLVELTDYAESLNPEFMVYCNWHTWHNTFGPPRLKALSTEDGQKCCYVGKSATLPHFGFECQGYITNGGLLRRMLATADGDRPLRIQSHKCLHPAGMEARDFEPYSGSDWQRLIAECWCYRAAQEIFIEGNFQTQLYAGEPKARQAWKDIGKYNRFHARHRDLWIAANRSEVAFAVLVLDNHPTKDDDWQSVRFLSALALEGWQYDVVLDHQLSPERLTKYPALWCPSAERLGEKELKAIESYLLNGGQVIVSGSFSECSSLGHARSKDQLQTWLKRLGKAGGARFVRETKAVDQEIARQRECGKRIPSLIRQAQDRFPVRVSCDAAPVLWTCWATERGEKVIFILNPDSRAARTNVHVEARETRSMTWHSPDASSRHFSVVSKNGSAVCGISRLGIFGFCVAR